jgi:hypothetical protein
MCGVICLYDDELECIHTTYIGVWPQKDEPAFTYQLTKEVSKLKQELEAVASRPTYVGPSQKLTKPSISDASRIKIDQQKYFQLHGKIAFFFHNLALGDDQIHPLSAVYAETIPDFF